MSNKHLITATSTLIEALEKLNSLSGGIMTLIVVNYDNVMVGTLTDGDIRRTLLRGIPLDSPVSEAMHTTFRALKDEDNDVTALRNMRSDGIQLVPVLDEAGHIVRLIELSGSRSCLPLQAVLMAGGRGERLRPLTDSLPKPLLSIDGKAIIDYNIEALAAAGIEDITVTTRYMASKIIEHFSQPVAGINVKCVVEEQPLGTIGALSLIHDRKPGGATLVMNSDLLTTVSLEEMYITHVQHNADITIGVIPYSVSVPYAILNTVNDYVTGIEEKPTYSYYANAGIYIISNQLLDDIVSDRHLDATDFIKGAIQSGNKVTYYPINGTWIDVGTPTDFAQAQELMKHLRNFSSR